MSDLKKRNPNLATNIEDYPELVRSLVSFITEPAVLHLLSAGGKSEGTLVFNVRKGEVISFIPQMEMKIGYEIVG